MPFSPNDELNLRFTVTEWNSILGQLQEGPWKIVAPLINKINLQAAQQEQEAAKRAAAAQQQPADAPGIARPPYTNGEMQPDIAVTGDSTGTIVLAKDE